VVHLTTHLASKKLTIRCAEGALGVYRVASRTSRQGDKHAPGLGLYLTSWLTSWTNRYKRANMILVYHRRSGGALFVRRRCDPSGNLGSTRDTW